MPVESATRTALELASSNRADNEAAGAEERHRRPLSLRRRYGIGSVEREGEEVADLRRAAEEAAECTGSGPDAGEAAASRETYSTGRWRGMRLGSG
jgi:hypothetical protein